MRASLVAVGRLRSGPERMLVDDYVERANRLGRSIGVHPITEIEIEPKSTGAEAQAKTLLEACSEGAHLIVLDERGRDLASEALSRKLADLRDGGVRDAAFLIGGADGLHQVARDRADFVLALGSQTWPHKLVRVMLAEQIYRAVAILAGAPYHRA